MKEAIIYTFSNALGNNFTTECLQAWELLFQYIVKKMHDGMNDTELVIPRE